MIHKKKLTENAVEGLPQIFLSFLNEIANSLSWVFVISLEKLIR